MASLFIKDAETAGLVARVAKRQGKTKTRAVRDLFTEAEAKLDAEQPVKRKPMLEWLLEYRKQHPLPPPNGFVADKAFYDSLNDEEDD